MTNPPRPRVSLCMIVRDEERNLAECLSPVAGLFDEVVIVDTGSRDRTKDIARQFTPQVFDFAWCDDFSAARNEGLRRATGDWIFWLDADDRIDEQNARKLQELLRNLPAHPAAYLLDTVCASRFECEDSRLISHCRLFRRHEAIGWSGRVHEQLRPHPQQLGYELLASDVQITHLGYREAALTHRKVQRDIRLLKIDYAVNPDDASTRLHLGLAYARVGKGNEARKWLAPLVRPGQPPADYQRQVYGVLADLALRDGQFSEALQLAADGQRRFAGDEYLAYLQAEALYELDHYDAAQQILVALMNGPQSWQFRAGTPTHIRHKLAPRRLADILRLQGNLPAAEALLLKILEAFPTDTLSWHTLGQAYISSQQPERLQIVVTRLRECPQGEIFGELLLATWHLTQNQLDEAEASVERLIAAAPQMPMPRLMRAELLRRQGAPREAILQACRDILRVQPGNVDVLRAVAELERQPQPTPDRKPSEYFTSVVLDPGIPGGVVRAG